MGIWVVILEAVATEGERGGLGIEPGALDDLAEELAGHYAVVKDRPGAYETELWVEEGTAGGAVLAAQFLWQAAVRYLGLPAWEVVRAEARDAHALETGIIDWPDPPVGPDEEPAALGPVPPSPPEPAPRPMRSASKSASAKKVAKKAPTKKVATTTVATKKAPAKKAPAKKVAPRKARGPRS